MYNTTIFSQRNVASDTRQNQRRREGPFKSTLRGGEKDAEYLLRRACNAYVPPQPQEGPRGRVDKTCPRDMLWHVAGWIMGTDGILKFHDGFAMFFMGLLYRFRSKVSQVTLWKMISNWPRKLNMMKSKHLAQIPIIEQLTSPPKCFLFLFILGVQQKSKVFFSSCFSGFCWSLVKVGWFTAANNSATAATHQERLLPGFGPSPDRVNCVAAHIFARNSRMGKV